MRSTLPTLLACLLLSLPAALAGDDVPARLEEAQRDLEKLEDLLDDRDATNRDITSYMEIVVDAAVDLQIPSAPEQQAEALDEKALRKLGEQLEEFHDGVVDILLEALDETNLGRGGINQREPVNILAGPLLVRTATFVTEARPRQKLSRRIIGKLRRLEKARHEVDAEVFGGAFRALAAFGDDRAMAWLMDEYLHTRKQPEDVARMRYAMQALRKWDPMPGKARHELVDEMLKLYVAVEALAGQRSTDVSAIAAKRFWDGIRHDAIALIQRASGYPTDASGRALASMSEFDAWFGEHESLRDPVWRDPAPEPRG